MADTGNSDRNHDYWIGRWTNKINYWHDKSLHPFISRHYEEIEAGQTLKILVPMCGKSLDMKWMSERGHTVVGVDCALEPCQEFFQESGIEFSMRDDVSGWQGSLYQSKDRKIRIYVGDFLSVFEQGRGGFGSVGPAFRGDYIKTLTQSGLLDPNCRIFIDMFSYDKALWPGPPDSFTEEEVTAYFSEFAVKKFDKIDDPEGKISGMGFPLEMGLYENIIKASTRSQMTGICKKLK